jgi:nucleotide-binding universal stress UspA family protein
MDTGSDFVVKASETASGIHRLIHASTDQHLLRKCPCPVWLQTPDAPHAPRRILAAIDVDTADADEPDTLAALNARVIDAALAVATPTGAEVVVLHAWDAVGEGLIWAFGGDRDARASADAYVNAILDARHMALDHLVAAIARPPTGGTAPRLTSRLVRGAPERVIADEARALRADLVVMGTVARTGLGGVFIGNTAENIINGLDRPVLAVKPAGFRSPLARAPRASD